MSNARMPSSTLTQPPPFLSALSLFPTALRPFLALRSQRSLRERFFVFRTSYFALRIFFERPPADGMPHPLRSAHEKRKTNRSQSTAQRPGSISYFGPRLSYFGSALPHSSPSSPVCVTSCSMFLLPSLLLPWPISHFGLRPSYLASVTLFHTVSRYFTLFHTIFAPPPPPGSPNAK